MPNKTPSFFDLVYNYFTDTKEEEDEREKQRKEEATELKAIQDMANKFLINSDYNQQEELKRGDEDPSLKERKFDLESLLTKNKGKLNELITLICT